MLDTRETDEVLGWDRGGSGSREEHGSRGDASGLAAAAAAEEEGEVEIAVESEGEEAILPGHDM